MNYAVVEAEADIDQIIINKHIITIVLCIKQKEYIVTQEHFIKGFDLCNGFLKEGTFELRFDE